MSVVCPRLNKKEFFDVYVASMLLDDLSKNDKRFLADCINDIAQKYVDITLFAVRAELRYALYGGTKGYSYCKTAIARGERNARILETLGIDPNKIRNKKERQKFNFAKAATFFSKGEWDKGVYGGKAWAQVARVGLRLQKALPCTTSNLKRIINLIDQLNDLEHNNDLYLRTYATFDVKKMLDFKMIESPEAVVAKASRELKSLWRKNNFSAAL
jgi:hypothetical protein